MISLLSYFGKMLPMQCFVSWSLVGDFSEPGEFFLLPCCEHQWKSNLSHTKAFGLTCRSGKMRGGRQEAPLLNLNPRHCRQKWAYQSSVCPIQLSGTHLYTYICVLTITGVCERWQCTLFLYCSLKSSWTRHIFLCLCSPLKLEGQTYSCFKLMPMHLFIPADNLVHSSLSAIYYFILFARMTIEETLIPRSIQSCWHSLKGFFVYFFFTFPLSQENLLYSFIFLLMFI